MNSGESRSERGGQSMTTNSGYSYPDTSKSPDAPMSYKEHSNGANASFVPFAKDFDTDKSLGPPYPRTLHAQSSDEKAFNKDKLSQPCQVHGYELSRCCQGRCSDGKVPTMPDIATTDFTLRRPWTCRAHLSSTFNPNCHWPLLCRYGRK